MPKPIRLFHFALSILLNESGKLRTALAEADYKLALTERLSATADLDLESLIKTLNDEILEQSSQRGSSGTLTREQNEALHEMRRLSSGARRSASLALKGQSVVLREEFQIGQSEEDSSLGAEVIRATKTQAASVKYATDLRREGWVPSDATALAAATAIVAAADLAQTASLADGVEFTADVIKAANALYTQTLRVQNAARLAYPLPRPGLEIPSATIGARSRFLLESYPPRNRDTPDSTTPPTP